MVRFWFGLWLCSIVHGGYVDYVERLRKAYLRGESSPMYQIMTMLMVSAGDIRAVQTEDRKIEFRGAKGNVKLSYVLTSPIGTFSAEECVVETCAVNPPDGEVLQWQVHTTTDWIFGVIRVAEGNITMPAARAATDDLLCSGAPGVVWSRTTVVDTNGLARYNMTDLLTSLEVGVPMCFSFAVNSEVAATVQIEMESLEETMGLTPISRMRYLWTPITLTPKRVDLKAGIDVNYNGGWRHTAKGVVNDGLNCKDIGHNDKRMQGNYYWFDEEASVQKGWYELYGAGGKVVSGIRGQAWNFYYDDNSCWKLPMSCDTGAYRGCNNNHQSSPWNDFLSFNPPPTKCTETADQVTFWATPTSKIYLQHGKTYYDDKTTTPQKGDGLAFESFENLIDAEMNISQAFVFSPNGYISCSSKLVTTKGGWTYSKVGELTAYGRALFLHARTQTWSSELLRPTKFIYAVRINDPIVTASIKVTVKMGARPPVVKRSTITLSGAPSETIKGEDVRFTFQTTSSSLQSVGPQTRPNYLLYVGRRGFDPSFSAEEIRQTLKFFGVWGNLKFTNYHCDIKSGGDCVTSKEGLWNGQGRPIGDTNVFARQEALPLDAESWTSGTPTKIDDYTYRTEVGMKEYGSGKYEPEFLRFQTRSPRLNKVQFRISGEFDNVYAVERELTPTGCEYIEAKGCCCGCKSGFELAFRAYSTTVGGIAKIESNNSVSMEGAVNLTKTAGTEHRIRGYTQLVDLNNIVVTITGSSPDRNCTFRIPNVKLARETISGTASPVTDMPTVPYGPTTKNPSSAPSAAVKTGGALPTWAIVLIAVGGVVVLFAVGICAAGNQQDSVV